MTHTILGEVFSQAFLEKNTNLGGVNLKSARENKTRGLPNI